MHIGILTGGGDCPGLNAAIRAITRTALHEYGSTVIGFLDGYRGLVENRFRILTDDTRIDRILTRGGTILGTARIHPDKLMASIDSIRQTYTEHKLDALITIGGEGTLKAGSWLSHNGFPVVGLPKTIDNDIDQTDQTFGFDTAASIATDAIDRLHSTAESHQRVMLVEVMGRHTGWIALYSGIASGAHLIVIPEIPFDIDRICAVIRQRFDRGNKHVICVVAEGSKPIPGTIEYGQEELDEFGHEKFQGITNILSKEIQKRVKQEVRSTVLGYVQRGGTPTPFDRVLATRYGVSATHKVHSGQFSIMVALHGQVISTVPLHDAVANLKTVPEDLYAQANIFFG